MDEILLTGPDANILEKYLMELKVYTITAYLKKKDLFSKVNDRIPY